MDTSNYVGGWTSTGADLDFCVYKCNGAMLILFIFCAISSLVTLLRSMPTITLTFRAITLEWRRTAPGAPDQQRLKIQIFLRTHATIRGAWRAASWGAHTHVRL